MYLCMYIYIYLDLCIIQVQRDFVFPSVLKPSRLPCRPSDAPGSASEIDGGSRIYEAFSAETAACDPRASEEVPVHRHLLETLCTDWKGSDMRWHQHATHCLAIFMCSGNKIQHFLIFFVSINVYIYIYNIYLHCTQLLGVLTSSACRRLAVRFVDVGFNAADSQKHIVSCQIS